MALSKVAAASLDDAVAQAGKAGTKAIGIVIDDAAVTPRYAVGFAASRELPIIGKIAMGSLWNKLVVLLPGALLLSLFAPWAITPLLMIGGVYLCFEGYKKVAELVTGHKHGAHGHGKDEALSAGDTASSQELERIKIAGAVRTDFILSAEIMAITLAAVEASPFWTKAAVLGIVGIGMTALVYGVVALIVKGRRRGSCHGTVVLRPRARSRPHDREGHAGLPRGPEHRRDAGDAVGRRRHHHSWPGGAGLAGAGALRPPPVGSRRARRAVRQRRRGLVRRRRCIRALRACDRRADGTARRLRAAAARPRPEAGVRPRLTAGSFACRSSLRRKVGTTILGPADETTPGHRMADLRTKD